MKSKLLLASTIAAFMAPVVVAENIPSQAEMWKIIQQQQKEIENLKSKLQDSESQINETRVIATTAVDAVEAIESGESSNSGLAQWVNNTTIGGYGEHHYNNFDDSDDQVDAHRFVLFVGHHFSDNLKFFSELEVEHGLTKDTADGSGPGEVELEQAYIQWDFAKNHSLVMGQYLIPVGIINETHEPETFYGTERNKVESNIIPATWWETGAMFQGEIMPGLSYNAAIHSGLKTSDGGSIRGGRQKSAKAVAEDPAYTLRLKYTGMPGLELAATAQYQSEITQGTAIDDSSATLLEAHAVYQTGPFAIRALWASWDVEGNGFDMVGRDEQEGWYIEPSVKALDNLGFFIRYSEYNNQAGFSASNDVETWDYGLNFWLNPRVVIKADYSDVRDNGDDSLNVGLGWSF